MSDKSQLIDQFTTFLTTNFQHDKMLKHVQFEKASVTDNKVTIKYYCSGKEGKVYVDLRELTENQNHFLHLLDNISDQLRAELT